MENTPLAVVSYPALIGAVISRIRKEKGMSQSDLAGAVEVGVSTWSRIESGESALSIEQLVTAADYLDVAPSSILQAVEERVASLRQKQVATVSARSQAQAVATSLGVIPLVGASLVAAVGPIGIATAAAAAGGYLIRKFQNQAADSKELSKGQNTGRSDSTQSDESEVEA